MNTVVKKNKQYFSRYFESDKNKVTIDLTMYHRPDVKLATKVEVLKSRVVPPQYELDIKFKVYENEITEKLLIGYSTDYTGYFKNFTREVKLCYITHGAHQVLGYSILKPVDCPVNSTGRHMALKRATSLLWQELYGDRESYLHKLFVDLSVFEHYMRLADYLMYLYVGLWAPLSYDNPSEVK